MRPAWLKVRLPGAGQYREVRGHLARLGVHTVCQEARCPNAAECWGGGTATFLILGDVCTRGCRFCAVTKGRPPQPPAADEPKRVAAAARALGLRYVVITSVDRDDLPDGGAAHYAATVRAVQEAIPAALIELLVPDFSGDEGALAVIASSGAQVVGHNLETVRELTAEVRDRRCSYDQSLAVLARLRALEGRLVLKSSLLLGLGETDEAVHRCLGDLRRAGVDWVTLGQYLQPTRRHAPVRRYVDPEGFDRLAAVARGLGFPLVTAGPLVRSSYRAAEEGAERLVLERWGKDLLQG